MRTRSSALRLCRRTSNRAAANSDAGSIDNISSGTRSVATNAHIRCLSKSFRKWRRQARQFDARLPAATSKCSPGNQSLYQWRQRHTIAAGAANTAVTS